MSDVFLLTRSQLNRITP